MNNKIKTSAKLSLLAAGVMVAGSLSANAMEVNIFDYEAMGNGNDVRSELLNTASVDYTAHLNTVTSKLEEGKCGEHKCGENKCGEGVEKNKKAEKKGSGEEETEKKGNGEEVEKKGTEEGEKGKGGEGKCGEGKCGL